MPGNDRYTIQILDVTLDLIECLLAGKGESLGTSEIARQLGINRSRALRILKTLERRGYVEADSQTRRYKLGLRFLEIGEQMQEQCNLRRVAEPVLIKLAQETGDAAHLLVLYRDSALCIESYQGGHKVQVTIPIDQALPLHIGASPKILLAHLPEDERERIIQAIELPPFTPNTMTDHDELRRCLEEIRAQGYAVDQEDFEVGVYAVGAPVRDHIGHVVASITVTTLESRCSPQRQQELIDLVVDAAHRISTQLGWTMDLSL